MIERIEKKNWNLPNGTAWCRLARDRYESSGRDSGVASGFGVALQWGDAAVRSAVPRDHGGGSGHALLDRSKGRFLSWLGVWLRGSSYLVSDVGRWSASAGEPLLVASAAGSVRIILPDDVRVLALSGRAA